MNAEDKCTQQLAMLEKCEIEENNLLVPNWLVDVLAWIWLIEMLEMSILCRIFNRLCWPKLHGKLVIPHFVPRIKIWPQKDGIGQSYVPIVRCRDQYIQIPSVPPPDYILGFQQIDLYFLDAKVLQFIDLIAPLINAAKLSFNTQMDGWDILKDRCPRRIGPMRRILTILAPKTFRMEFRSIFGDHLTDFSRLFPEIVDQFQFIACRPNEKMAIDILFDWLHKLGENGQKVLQLEFSYGEQYEDAKFIKRIQQQFINSTKPINFFLQLSFNHAEFHLENTRTGEVLELYRKRDPNIWRNEEKMSNFLGRYKKGEEWRWKWEGEQKCWHQKSGGIGNEEGTIFGIGIRRFGNFEGWTKWGNGEIKTEKMKMPQ